MIIGICSELGWILSLFPKYIKNPNLSLELQNVSVATVQALSLQRHSKWKQTGCGEWELCHLRGCYEILLKNNSENHL